MRFGLAAAAVLAAAAAGPALSDPAPGVWSSGYQMGSFWAAVKTREGDALSLSCSEGVPGNPAIRKGLSVRLELAAIAEDGLKAGDTADVAFTVRGRTMTLPMIVESPAAMALADLGEVRAEAGGLANALLTGDAVSVAFAAHRIAFALKGSKAALEGIAECAAAADPPR